MSISTEALWKRYTKLIGREDLTNDPRFTGNANRTINQHYLNNLAAAWAADKTVEEALRLLDEAHIPCGTVQTITEVVEDSQVKAREN
ncbi:MAG: CoA transferase [Desulfobacteraceae bacterium]|nr:CoA transferase [Desulfobacteraceae bacterium]